MPRHLRLPFLLLLPLLVATNAEAQSAGTFRPPQLASAVGGRVHGTVVDEIGDGVADVSVLAMGTSVAAAMTDKAGRFSLALPAGDYVLRAAREGYVSTYREPVRVRANALLRRTIKLLRADADQVSAQVEEPGDTSAESESSDIAWRLRHLPRTILRNTAHGDDVEFESLPRPSSLIEWAVTNTARATTSFFAETDFTGHVNLLTRGSVALVPRLVRDRWSPGIADFVVGAPVGTRGDWFVQGAIVPGDASSWTLLGEYRGRQDQEHALRVTVSYSTQGFVTGRDLPTSLVAPESRSAGAVHVTDRWRVHPSTDVEYGLRLDRYDYLTVPQLVSPSVAVRSTVFGDTSLTASLGERVIAPGADQFLPPATAGPWLPPERTFSPLSSGSALVPAQVHHRALGVSQAIGESAESTVAIEWFMQSTTNQLATLFGLDESSVLGHYYVARVGHVGVSGWRARIQGELSRHVKGRIEYARGTAQWTRVADDATLGRRVPAALRRGDDRVHDLRAGLDVAVPETDTYVTVGMLFSQASSDARPSTVAANRFNVELRQQLPFQPLGGGKLHLLFSVRTLLHDDEAGSIFDELLTMAPPARVTAGLQVRF